MCVDTNRIGSVRRTRCALLDCLVPEKQIYSVIVFIQNENFIE